jgi:hypothetical protein
MFICCGVLCMALLLFCGTALAAVEVTPGDDASVTVAKDAEEKVFKVTKTGVTDGQLYLVMIQKGDANAKPTAENLYYLNVDKASSATFTMDAYPKDLDEGTYVVYLSDYANSNGGRKSVATLSVTSGGGGGGGGGGGSVLYGDVDGNGKVKSWDATVLACYLAGQSEFQNINLQNADCNGDGKVKSWDLTVLYCHLAGQSEFAQLPYKGN